ncbi:MAG: transporter related [Peptococcaceae bacterium]|jgi:tungstate transport system ATP-binding protein|nr:transporter related [Peptococcaceae bacterium]
MLEIKDISQCYGPHWVLKEINFTFEEGRIYGIIGPNGAGKSTLLRVLTAMEKPRAGEIWWEKKLLTQPIPEITCMWQKPYLFQTTVKENLLYGLKIRKWPQREQNERLEYLLDKFRLREYKHKYTEALSGGEGARVALARAIAPRPRLLVLDEPAANLDPGHTGLLENILKEICRAEGMAAIVVTHDMFQAKRLADITLFLSEGRLIEAGTTDLLFTQPQSEKTRKFISGEI